MKLLLDEHLSPHLALRCAQDRRIYAVGVAHLGLSQTRDSDIWQYALDHDFTMVTTNARDFLRLLSVDVRPGLIILREGGLSRDEQWQRLIAVIDYIECRSSAVDSDTANYMVNRVIEIESFDPLRLVDREIPSL